MIVKHFTLKNTSYSYIDGCLFISCSLPWYAKTQNSGLVVAPSFFDFILFFGLCRTSRFFCLGGCHCWAPCLAVFLSVFLDLIIHDIESFVKGFERFKVQISLSARCLNCADILVISSIVSKKATDNEVYRAFPSPVFCILWIIQLCSLWFQCGPIRPWFK